MIFLSATVLNIKHVFNLYLLSSYRQLLYLHFTKIFFFLLLLLHTFWCLTIIWMPVLSIFLLYSSSQCWLVFIFFSYLEHESLPQLFIWYSLPPKYIKDYFLNIYLYKLILFLSTFYLFLTFLINRYGNSFTSSTFSSLTLILALFLHSFLLHTKSFVFIFIDSHSIISLHAFSS